MFPAGCRGVRRRQNLRHEDLSLEAAKAMGEKLDPRGKKVAVYCPSGMPQSRELILNNLGYAILYDARRQEWGNREGTPVERDAPAGESGSRRKSWREARFAARDLAPAGHASRPV